MVDYTEIWHPQFYGNEETSTSYRIAAQYANVRRLTQFTPGTVYTVDPMNSRAARFVGRQGRLVEFEEENWVPTWGVLQWMDTHRTGRVKLRDLVDHSTTLYERPAIQYNRPYLNDCQVTVPWAVRHEWKTEAPLLSLLVVGIDPVVIPPMQVDRIRILQGTVVVGWVVKDGQCLSLHQVVRV